MPHARIRFLTATSLFLGLAVFGCASSEQGRFNTLWVNKPAPDFTLKDLSQTPVTLSDFRGKPVLLAFWAYG
jgi:cytochrome oxidase Cu insertion factor (SCO1/SenC/PrrC family)